MPTYSLDLGCGLTPKNPFNADEVYGVDVAFSSPQVKSVDLAVDKIPYSNEFFDFVTAFDFIEHIPRVLYYPERRLPFVNLMNEIYRVLRPNGMFLSFTPAYPNNSAFSDPTHINIITIETFPLFVRTTPAMKSYGFFGKFDLVINRFHDWQSWPLVATTPPPDNTHLLTVLRKPAE